MYLKSFIFHIVFIIGCNAICDKNLISDLSFKISGVNVEFSCENTKNIYITSGRYVPKNMIPIRMQIYKDWAILALPRYREGVPFCLAKFSLKTKGCHATLEPFPCWSLQEEGNCDAFQSVVDIYLDPFENLWVLDTGIVNTLDQPVKRCPPKIVGINMKTGQIIKVIDLSKFLTPLSKLQYILVDFDKSSNPFAYVSDAGAAAIVVYDVLNDKGFRIMLPNTITDLVPQRDVLYIVLSQNEGNGNEIFFTYLSDPKMYSINSEDLQAGKTTGVIRDEGLKPTGSPIVPLGTDNGAAIFFRFKGESDIYLWDTETSFKVDNFFLIQKGDECRLPTQVVPGYKKLMWVLESNFPDFIANMAGSLGPSVAVYPLIKACDKF
ncbi:major royal jelly protein 1-like [Agrilus planipennis]|uniref:Major royal jelly protein 1-like n=1 Tax=Agrilus planipennis TaxID=224129 RepID=A0A1W4XRX6_AGRPL|nr:major royal jelly protein 1-like [Agrilus planipennis]